MDWFFRFPHQSQLYIYTELSLHEAQREQHKNECFCSPFIFLLINSLFKKAAAGLLPNVWDSRRVQGVMNSPVNNFMPEHQPILEEVES